MYKTIKWKSINHHLEWSISGIKRWKGGTVSSETFLSQNYPIVFFRCTLKWVFDKYLLNLFAGNWRIRIFTCTLWFGWNSVVRLKPPMWVLIVSPVENFDYWWVLTPSETRFYTTNTSIVNLFPSPGLFLLVEWWNDHILLCSEVRSGILTNIKWDGGIGYPGIPPSRNNVVITPDDQAKDMIYFVCFATSSIQKLTSLKYKIRIWIWNYCLFFTITLHLLSALSW